MLESTCRIQPGGKGRGSSPGAGVWRGKDLPLAVRDLLLSDGVDWVGRVEVGRRCGKPGGSPLWCEEAAEVGRCDEEDRLGDGAAVGAEAGV